MWWLVAAIVAVVIYSMYFREGLGEDSVGGQEEDPSVKTLLTANEKGIEDLDEKVNTMRTMAESVTSLENRIQGLESSLQKISDMCVKCTA